MSNTKRRKLKSKTKIVGFIIIFLIATVLIGGLILDRLNDFHFSKELTTEVLNVSGIGINVSEFCYYIYIVEEDVQEKAYIYNPENPLEYWNLHFSAGLDSAFMMDMAKDTAYDACISDFVYYEMAMEEGHELAEEERIQAIEEAQGLFTNLSDEQKEKTGLTLPMLENILTRRALAKDYAIHFALQYTKLKQTQNPEAEFTKEEILEELSPGGSYYEQVLKQQYEITINSYIYDQLPMGKITVNY